MHMATLLIVQYSCTLANVPLDEFPEAAELEVTLDITP